MRTAPSVVSAPAARPPEIPFGVNEMRLNARQWLLTLIIVLAIGWLTPRVWQKIERFETGPDYRMPYQLSKDYWLYDRRLRQVCDAQHVIVLGDSVVWGEYVLPNGTLAHFLNHPATGAVPILGAQGPKDRFINAGVNGAFPLALEGLVKYHSPGLRGQKVLVHCNPLWMTSPKADLSSQKEESFNHAGLVPQFFPRIPCYRAEASDRLSAVVARHVGFVGWVNHLQCAYFGEKSFLKWTLEEDSGGPAKYPNTYKNPLAQIKLVVPSAPADDPERGPKSPRHKAWSGDATQFEWVDLNNSLQWQAFQRVIDSLQARGNQVFVLLGPFNEHMMTEENRMAYRRLRDGMDAWLTQNKIPHLAPNALPRALYADASHPLTEGYAQLANELYSHAAFQEWLKK